MIRSTVRVRLTALYSGLFLITSTTLLVVVNLLLRNMLHEQVTDIERNNPPPSALPVLPSPSPGASPIPANAEHSELESAVSELSRKVLRFQWGVTVVIIALLTIVSVIVGWWLAGRILRPLHQITATARRLSASNLDERIALTGRRDELTELADTFDAMLARLQQSVESQRQFIANAAHELRTPLATQRASIQIGLEDPSPERLIQSREELLTSNQRLTRLIDGLLVLAQGEHRLIATEPVALDDVVQQIANQTSATEIQITLNTEPTTVSGDPVLLSRLVTNLVDNAIRYNRPDGTVEISLIRGSLTVRNTGPEIPPERINELFRPFRRLAADRTQSTHGAGLGLSIVAAIAQAHNAIVTAKPNLGGGLELIVQFSPGH